MSSAFPFVSKIHIPPSYSRATPSRPQTPHSQLRQQERETRELDDPSHRRIPNHDQSAHAGPSSGLMSFGTQPIHPTGHGESYSGVSDGAVCVDYFNFNLLSINYQLKILPPPHIFY